MNRSPVTLRSSILEARLHALRHVDPVAEFAALPLATREAVCFWIEHVYVPAKTTFRRSSYGQKHDLQRDCGLYVRSEEFAGAMLACGFAIGDVHPSLDGANFYFRCRPAFSRRNMRLEERLLPQESIQHANETDRAAFAALVARSEAEQC